MSHLLFVRKFRWIQIRMDLLTGLSTFIFILVAIILGDQRLISLGAVAMIINSGISVSQMITKDNLNLEVT